MKNYEDVLKHLNLALNSCRDSSETENLRVLIKQIIINFEKLIKKHKNRAYRPCGVCKECREGKLCKKTLSYKEEKKIYFPNPQLSLDVLDNLIKEQKNAINDN